MECKPADRARGRARDMRYLKDARGSARDKRHLRGRRKGGET